MADKISQLNIIWWIRDADTMSGSAKLVLVMLASRVNEKDGWSAFPSVSQIAEDCKASDKTVQRALRKLEKADLIRTVERPYTSSVYYLNVRKIYDQASAAKAAKAEAKKLPASPYEQLTQDQAVQLDADEQKIISELPSFTLPGAAPAPKPDTNSPVAAALMALPRVGKRLSSKDAASVSRGLCKSHPEDQVLTAIRSLKVEAVYRAFEADKPAAYLRTCIIHSVEHPDEKAELGLIDDKTLQEYLDNLVRPEGSGFMEFSGKFTAEGVATLTSQIKRLGGPDFSVDELAVNDNSEHAQELPYCVWITYIGVSTGHEEAPAATAV